MGGRAVLQVGLALGEMDVGWPSSLIGVNVAFAVPDICRALFAGTYLAPENERGAPKSTP